MVAAKDLGELGGLSVSHGSGNHLHRQRASEQQLGGPLHAHSLELAAEAGAADLGQRALELPTALVTDQYSLSDAEDFTEGYRSLGLGKVVGEPTAGWIIYTSNVQLVDGTVFRLPFMRIQTAEGVDMERNPRPVDVTVARPVGEGYTGHDSQLDAAVRELLGRR